MMIQTVMEKKCVPHGYTETCYREVQCQTTCMVDQCVPYQVRKCIREEQEVEVCVPVMTKEMRKITKNVCRIVEEEQEITVCVPIMTKEMRKCTKQVCRMVEEEKEIQVCVPVMTKETRTCKVNVCNMVEEEVDVEVCTPVCTMVEKEVCCRMPVQVSCSTTTNGCGGCCSTTCGTKTIMQHCVKKVMVPCTTMSKSTQKVKCCKPVMSCVDKEYEVCVCKMETQTKTVKCCRPVVECVESEYEVCVCKMEQQTRTVKCCKTVVDCVEEEVEVCVCKMEKQTKKICVCRQVCETAYRMCKVPVKTMTSKTVPYTVRKTCMIEKEVCRRVCVPVSSSCNPCGGMMNISSGPNGSMEQTSGSVSQWPTAPGYPPKPAVV